MTADEVRAAFERWQRGQFLHPLTCHDSLGVHATTPTSCTLKCAACGWEQHIEKGQQPWAYLFEIAEQLHAHPGNFPWEVT